MAAATKNKNQPPPPAPAPAPAAKFEWAEKAGSYVLRLTLPAGFNKDDFRVQVDGAGRLTVRGSRPAAAGRGSLHKVFQLPSTANLDEIAGRFQAGVLTLTIPKRAAPLAPAPTSIEEIKRKLDVGKETKANEEDALKKAAMDKKAQQQNQHEEEEKAKSQKQEQQKPPAPVKKEEVKPKAPQLTPVKKEEEMKPKAPQAAAATPPPEKSPPKPECADKAKPTVAHESLAETVSRPSEVEQRDKQVKAEREKKALAVSGWKEGSMRGFKGLTDMKWADGVVEAARNNKEAVAVGITAFSIGFLVSQKLFRK
ncbi:histone-lysine N-methyltransferase 2B-like [Lolium rigidum]|uniref:histone-lysine N-methyltransferase 2B-like n=1 Tax=Lolium rigidum TaxID=89674 RepID=UPI001F5C0DC7|nr:histone-lysine N-methyltransferase 2B-like [Lolium rigidum]